MQIGPRIRVGGSLGHAAQNAKVGLGKVASNHWVQAGLGALTMNPLLVAGLATAGRAADTSDGSRGFGDLAMAGVKGGLSGWAGAQVGGMARGAQAIHAGTGAGYGQIAKTMGSKVLSLPGMAMHGAARRVMGDGGDDGGGMADSLADHGRGILDKLGGAGGLLDKGLMAGAIAAAAADRQKQSQMLDEAKGYATQSYAERAPLRTRALSGLTDPTSGANKTPDLSSIYGNTGSVYDKVGPKVPARIVQ